MNVDLLACQLQLVHMTKLFPVFYQVHFSFTALAVVPTQLGHTIVIVPTPINISRYKKCCQLCEISISNEYNYVPVHACAVSKGSQGVIVGFAYV